MDFKEYGHTDVYRYKHPLPLILYTHIHAPGVTPVTPVSVTPIAYPQYMFALSKVHAIITVILTHTDHTSYLQSKQQS